MVNRNFWLGVAVAGGVVVTGAMSNRAEAALSCGGTAGTSDVSLSINYPPSVTYYASSCALLAPANSSPATETAAFNNALTGAGTADNFVYLDKSDSAGTALNGILFTVTAAATGGAPAGDGTWTISWVDTNGGAPLNLPIMLDLGVMLKAANNPAGSLGAYILEDVLIPASPNSGSGSFQIAFTNNGGQIPEISHLTLVGRLGAPVSVPEPATLALLGAGLLGLGLARRARRKA